MFLHLRQADLIIYLFAGKCTEAAEQILKACKCVPCFAGFKSEGFSISPQAQQEIWTRGHIWQQAPIFYIAETQ